MNQIYEKITHIFDPLHHLWEHEKMHRKISIALVLFFLSGIFGIEANRLGYLPASLAAILPENHFFAIQAAFTVVLIMEVISHDDTFEGTTNHLIQVAKNEQGYSEVVS